MTVLRIDAARGLACAADVKAVRLFYMYILIGILCDSWSDNRKVLFLLAAGRASVDKRRCAGLQVFVPYESSRQ